MTNKTDQTQLFGFRHLVAATTKEAPAVQAKVGGGKGPARAPSSIAAVTSKVGILKGPTRTPAGYHAVTSKIGTVKAP